MTPFMRAVELAVSTFRSATRRFAGSTTSAADAAAAFAMPRLAPNHLPSMVWHARTFSSISEAEDLCDWLDMHGVKDQDFAVLGNATFEVRWR